MSIRSTGRSVQQLIDRYSAIHSTITPETFLIRPSADEWSLAEIYHHVFDANFLAIATMAALAAGEDDGGDASIVGKAILFTGLFPPGIKFKAPGRLLARLQAMPHLESADFIRTFEDQFITAITVAEQTDPLVRKKHPRLGYFNAEQWLRFMEIHMKHHLKQVDRNLTYFKSK